jgi:hypothetical protein
MIHPYKHGELTGRFLSKVDIIVTGSGGSGTAFTAQTIHYKYGACFGECRSKLVDPTPVDKLTWGRLEAPDKKKDLYTENYQLVDSDGAERFLRRIHHPDGCKSLLCIKNNKLAYCTPSIWFEFVPKLNVKLVLWCYRPIEVIHSIIGDKRYRMLQARILNLTALYEHKDRQFPMLKLNFHEGIDEAKLLSIIAPYMLEICTHK